MSSDGVKLTGKRVLGSFIAPVAGVSAIGGPLLGSTAGVAGGAVSAFKTKEKIKSAREEAERGEQARQAFNESIFKTANQLSGKVASNPNFDLTQLKFLGGDSRSGQLSTLVNALTRRQSNIQQRRRAPGAAAQTRLVNG